MNRRRRRELETLLAPYGKPVLTDTGGGHVKVVLDGVTTIVPATPGDRRSNMNLVADVRRQLRRREGATG